MGVFLHKEKIKVLLLIDAMGIGGAETHLLTLAAALIKKQVEVEVMCDHGVYAEALRQKGATVTLTPFKDRSIRGFLKCAKMLHEVRRKDFFAVHAHTRYTALLASLFLRNVPLVTTVHLDFSLAPLKRLLSRWGRKSLAVSEDLREYLTKEYGTERENVFLTKNGIDTDAFHFIPVRGKSILHVSRLDKDRSLCAHMLCAIAPALHRAAPDARIRIYGDGDDLASLKAAARAANEKAGETVVFLMGSTPSVQSVLSEGALLIGVSRAALEGAASGLPIILSGNDGYGGILDEECYEKHKYDNFCCRKCQKADEKTLLADILKLLESDCFCENLRSRIAHLVRKDFSPESMAEDALCAYRAARRTAIIGYYGYGNFGDEMMHRQIRKALSAQGLTNVLHLSAKKEERSLWRKRPLRTLFLLRRCDRVYFGGGNLLQSETSTRSLLYYALLLLACRKDTCEGIGMGLGGFRSKATEKLCGYLLPRFRSLSLRTEQDAETALRLAPKMAGKIRLTCDPCLHVSARTERKHGTCILAITRRRPSEAMLEFLRAKRHAGETVILAVLFSREDEEYARETAATIGAVLRHVRHAEDFFALAKNARLCISERLHGAIFSLLSRTPCLLSSESQKNRAFLRDCEKIAKGNGFLSPVLPFRSATKAFAMEKEAEGRALGFLEMIRFFRDRYVAY